MIPMKMLIKVNQWIQAAFVEGSRPSINTVKKWHSAGEIDGVVLGSALYIEVEGGKAAIGELPKPRTWRVK